VSKNGIAGSDSINVYECQYLPKPAMLQGVH
jgi:hypothetical protein